MEPGEERSLPPPPIEERPVFARSPPPRAPERELKDRAKAAKLRHKAAKARMKARRMQDRSRHLTEKANVWERRADELDRILSPQA